MESFPFNLELGVWRPITIFSGAVAGGSSLSAPLASNRPYVFVILGIDAYASVQPNNGDIQFIMDAPVSITAAPQLPTFQQSQNFPGPYYWRGAIPVEDRVTALTAEGTVPFSFNIWGLIGPNFQQFG